MLTFIAAHNNLEKFGRASRDELLALGSNEDVILGAFFDGKSGAAVYTMGVDAPGAVEEQKLLGNVDSGDASAVVVAAQWLFGKYPAERYGLVLWSHGTGWEPAEISAIARDVRPQEGTTGSEASERAMAPGSRALFRSTVRTLLTPARAAERAILFDDGSGHSLDTLELGRVLEEISQSVGQPVDLVGMDACLMANLEVAFELRDHARYLVASQELVPARSWPYSKIYGALLSQPDMTAESLARLVVREYIAYYTAHPPLAGDITKVALDLSCIGDLVTAVDALAACLIASIQTSAMPLSQAQIDARRAETLKGARKASKFDYHLWDLGSLARRLTAIDPAVNEAAQSLCSALNGAGAVLAEGHVGEWFDGVGGLTIYLPTPPKATSDHYQSLRFARETRWPELLRCYRKQISPDTEDV